MAERPILFSGPMVRAILDGRKTQTRRPVKGLRVRLRHEVASEPAPVAGCSPPLRAAPSVYGAKMNLHGAVAIELPGRPEGVRTFLGVKPQEFDFLCPYAAGHTYLRRHPDGRMAWHLQPDGEQRLWVRETFSPLDADHFTDPGRPRDLLSDRHGSPRRNGAAYLADTLNKQGEEDGDSKRCRLDLGYRWKPGIHMPRWASRLLLEVTEIRVERLDAITEDDARAEGMEGVREPGDADLRYTFRRRWAAMYGAGSPFQGVLDPWVWVVSFRRVEAAP